MAAPDPEKWPVQVSGESTKLSASSSSSGHTPEDVERESIREGPAHILTPTISHISQPPLSKKLTLIRTTDTSDPNFEVDWEDANDPTNPKNFSTLYKIFILFSLSLGTVSV